MDVKISELSEYGSSVSEYGDMYVPCVQVSNDSEIPYKYNLGKLGDSLNNTYNSVIGTDEIPLFDSGSEYLAGNFVRYYNSDSGKTEIWKFIKHHIGEWNSEDAMKTSIYNELKNISSGDNETVHISVYKKDLNGTTTPITTTSVYIDLGDKNTRVLQVDSNGELVVTIPYKNIYKIYVTQEINGYSTPPSYSGIVSSVYDRYLTFEYVQNLNQTINLEIQLNLPEDCILNQNALINDASGAVYLFNNNNNSSYYKSSMLNSNLIATFNNIETGVYKVLWSYGGYAVKNFFFDSANNVDHLDIYAYKYNSDITENYNNLYIVTSDFNIEIPITQFKNAILTGDTIYDNENNQIDYNSWEYIHIYSGYNFYGTSYYNLAKRGCDYYVKLKDLFKQSNNYVTKKWLSSNLKLDHVETSEYDGKRQTYFMAFDAKENFLTSNAAEWVNRQEVIYSPTNVIMRGFIGSYYQLYPLFNPDNANTLYYIANYLNINLSSGQSYTINPSEPDSSNTNAYYIKSIWTSNQTSSAGSSYAWSCSGKTFNSVAKTNSSVVIPLYSPH